MIIRLRIVFQLLNPAFKISLAKYTNIIFTDSTITRLLNSTQRLQE